MKITFAKPEIPSKGIVVVTVNVGNKLSSSAKTLDVKTGGALSRAIGASRFEGKKAQTLNIVAPERTKLDLIMIVGLGKPTDITNIEMQNLGGRIYAATKQGKNGAVSIVLDTVAGSKMKSNEMAAEIGYGAKLRSYSFNKYKTQIKADQKVAIKAVKITCDNFVSARKVYGKLSKIADGVFFTRDLVSEPPNILYPETLAKEAKTLEKLGIKVQILGESQMRKMGMGALLGVGQGSIRESKLVVMQWNGGSKSKSKSSQPIAFVGKGVTFDTGGISIKPSAGMEDMKWDMGGSAVVIGLMKALAGRKANVNAVGVVGLVENMPDGNAQRPGDIVTSMSGQTIEVLNTDAEGRLVLADALYYTNRKFKPKFMVNLATLTGAIIVSLGSHHAGLFSNNDQLSDRLTQAGLDVEERLWRLPISDDYDKMIDSQVADMQNIGGRGAGSITAAQFLHRFVGKTPWAHLDIAGVTWSKSDKPTIPKGGTAFGVRLLDKLVENYYEG